MTYGAVAWWTQVAGSVVFAVGMITTNRPVGSWGDILGDTTVAAAMLDRLLHRSVVINLDGDSYRLRDHHARSQKLRRVTKGARQPRH